MSEIERLRDRVAELEEMLGIRFELPNALGLTPLEARIVGVLIKREIASRDYIYWAVYGDLPDCDQPDIKTIEVHIVKIRRKLAAHGISILNRYNVGYYVDKQTRDTLKKLSQVPAEAA